ncbi:thaumatin-like protein 1b [Iris pallida]|uniref:Thaumatin-like protein 1b n=1 Tax=Iris pallida TaxID=29817 RepID=A0AAX6F1T2_IRIPA|nr:thaumatin-like protein 1b [Iris pallida]KAJ6833299.1 thaumatin-like protein 1b [Iris pallida]
MISPKLYSMGTFFNLIFVFTVFLLQGVDSTTFTLTNNCPFKVWPGTLHGDRSSPLSQTGLELGTGASAALTAPTGWIGRLWARTGCTTDASGRFSCQTGDCGTGSVSCNGAGGAPPVTLFEFTLQGDGGKDFYDVSLVDGFNIPGSISADGGSGECRTIGCPVDINARCPAELQLKPGGGAVVGCKSACEAFDNDEYCCRGAYGTPGTCKPSSFSQIFKNACPQAYSYAFDDQTSIFTCTGANYLITFCP